MLPLDRVDAIIHNGTDRRVDSYSALRNNWNEHGERPATGLTGHLRERGVEQVHICGLTRDFCVLSSAEDAADAGFETTVIWDLTRPVNPASDAAVRAALAEKRVQTTDFAGAG